GHLLPETCVLARDVRLRGLGFSGACFQRVSDPETGFDLFKPEANGPAIANPDARLVRIGPNVELGGALIALCRDAGWSRASVHGVGSLIGARFQDGSRMNSFATEFMMREGRILNAMNETGACAKIDISLVGLDGSFMSGRLAAHRNPVLITAELVLKRL
ncbi:MAG: hypothetical protein ACE5DK_02855, partial [Paracoccaceae bacterium]